MQALVLLLTTSLVHGAVSTSKREAKNGHIGYASCPNCYDEIEVRCVDIPQQEEHEECDLIFDITYVKMPEIIR